MLLEVCHFYYLPISAELTNHVVIRMDGLQEPSRTPMSLFNFNSKEGIAQFATGCDADVGGLSTVHLDLETNPAVNTPIGKPATARFWGEMKVGVKPEVQGRVRGGYAGFRNKVRSNSTPGFSPHKPKSLSQDRHFSVT